MGQWTTVSPPEALRRLKRGARAVDVRSPGEFDRGFIPGFANVPILNDSHRHDVGLEYKQKGQPAAIELGLKLVTPLRTDLVEDWRRVLAEGESADRLLICWRGGLRSKMAAEWLSEADFEGTRVTGGYKAMRHELLDAIAQPREFLVLGGLTGTGKSELLQTLPQATVLDLETYANHRGSSFGLRMNSLQPQQQTFENAVGLALFEGPALMVVENESRLIGKCALPVEIKAAMERSSLVLLEDSQEGRVRRIFAEYVQEPVANNGREPVRAHLLAALDRIQKRLGGLRHQKIRAELLAAFQHDEIKCDAHVPWIESLLHEYYDPMYEFARQNGGRPVAFSGDAKAVQDYLTHRLGGRRA